MSSPNEEATNPRALLLALLQAFGCDVPVQVLIQAADLFAIDENRTRVALHRLRAKGLVESHERGTYRIETQAVSSTSEPQASWMEVLDQLQPWAGTWIAAHTAPLPRADKTVARRRDRATHQVGMRELQPGLQIRPHNLAGGVERVRQRLHEMGLETDAPVFALSDLGPHEEHARTLWDDLTLNERYRHHIQRLTRLTLQVGAMPSDAATREAFVSGGEAVQDILSDPLLPAPLVDPALREDFVQTLSAFDDVGRELWSKVLDTDLELRRSPTIEPH